MPKLDPRVNFYLYGMPYIYAVCAYVWRKHLLQKKLMVATMVKYKVIYLDIIHKDYGQ